MMVVVAVPLLVVFGQDAGAFVEQRTGVVTFAAAGLADVTDSGVIAGLVIQVL